MQKAKAIGETPGALVGEAPPFISFPLHGIREGACKCGRNTCSAVGKHPKIARWQDLLESYPAEPGDGLGILTGVRGLFVVDVDEKDGIPAHDRLAKYAAGRQVPDTLTVRTGGGGLHLYYRTANESSTLRSRTNALGPRIDVRADRGYVVAPGTAHVSGGMYEIARDLPIAILDSDHWIVADLRASEAPAPRQDRPVPPPAEVTPEVSEAAIEYLKGAAPAIEGKNGSLRAFEVAYYLTRGLQLPIGVAAELWREHYNSRCEPPWSDREILHKLEDGATNGPMMPGCRRPELLRVVLPSPSRAPLAECKPSRKVRNTEHKYTYDTAGGEVFPTEKTVQGTIARVVRILTAGEWSGVWQLDTFADEVHAIDPPCRLDAETKGLSAVDISNVQRYLETREGVIASPDLTQRAIHAAAAETSYDPAREYLEGLPEEDPAFLEGKAREFFGDCSEMANTYFVRWLTGAVARVMSPGCKMDNALVLLSEGQGMYKSTFGRVLFGQWYSDQIPDLSGRDASHMLRGRMCQEIPEWEAVLRAGQDVAKSFMSRCVEHYRAFGTGERVTFPRTCVFLGTANGMDILVDETGNRRAWIVEVTQRIPVDLVASLRDRLFAAALARYRTAQADIDAGVLGDRVRCRWWLSSEEEEAAELGRTRYMKADVWQDATEKLLKGRAGQLVTVGEMLEELAGVGKIGGKTAFDLTQAAKIRMARVLKAIGCTQTKTHGVRKHEVPERFGSKPVVAPLRTRPTEK